MPTFALKTYQRNALEALTLFLRQSQTMGLEAAWAHAMKREGIAGVPYRQDDLAGAPCVCLRIPTGGGKTLMASHAIVGMAREWAQCPYPVALWLVPSDTIRSQTLGALKTPGHAYRSALEDAYGGALEICDLERSARCACQRVWAQNCGGGRDDSELSGHQQGWAARLRHERGLGAALQGAEHHPGSGESAWPGVGGAGGH
ncbi:MAG: DEAD/DEAH box helicase family protein [Betaproteobacteria bacterium]|nr:DEAD/DEAH box helicase family protein [Betaproteobacteria bacterium]